jgi:hypothetical protein
MQILTLFLVVFYPLSYSALRDGFTPSPLGEGWEGGLTNHKHK